MRGGDFFQRSMALHDQIVAHEVFPTVDDVLERLEAPDAVGPLPPPAAYHWLYRLRLPSGTDDFSAATFRKLGFGDDMIAVFMFNPDNTARLVTYSPTPPIWAGLVKVPKGASKSLILSLSAVPPVQDGR